MVGSRVATWVLEGIHNDPGACEAMTTAIAGLAKIVMNKKVVKAVAMAYLGDRF